MFIDRAHLLPIVLPQSMHSLPHCCFNARIAGDKKILPAGGFIPKALRAFAMNPFQSVRAGKDLDYCAGAPSSCAAAFMDSFMRPRSSVSRTLTRTFCPSSR